VVARMAGSMQAAEAAGRLSALLSLLALRRLLAVLQPLALLLLLPFRWRARPGAAAADAASDAAPSASGATGKKGKASASVVLRVPAGSPMVAARRQASARREIAIRRAREGGREYELISTARGETLFTQCWWPYPPTSTSKPR
jgi:acylglycerol lipase